jgi:hypothetical protein
MSFRHVFCNRLVLDGLYRPGVGLRYHLFFIAQLLLFYQGPLHVTTQYCITRARKREPTRNKREKTLETQSVNEADTVIVA